LIRLAVRCEPERAEVVLAELTVLAPNGVEEERGSGYVEYAIYGAEGELPELGELEAAAGSGLVEVVSTRVPDDWADRWRDFHRPITVGDRLCVRPSWVTGKARSDVLDVVVDPGRAFGTGAHPTTRLCLELLLELAAADEAGGPLTDLGTGSGVLAIAAAKLGWDPVTGYDHEPAALVAAEANAAANEVEIAFEQLNLRERLPSLAPTTVANLTAPVLSAIAAKLGAPGDQGDAPRSVPAVALRSSSSIPETLICSGLLTNELDEVIEVFEPAELVEADRRLDGDWAALLLRRR
jgi:ribosomal protein L11 methyltransferase